MHSNKGAITHWVLGTIISATLMTNPSPSLLKSATLQSAALQVQTPQSIKLIHKKKTMK
jgi:hypothetical protein